jgi:hypothetical protein
MVYRPLLDEFTAACLTLARTSLCYTGSGRVLAAELRSLEAASAHGQASVAGAWHQGLRA